MRLIVLASGAFAQPTINWLAQSRHQIALVVTQPARGSGRGRSPTPTPVKILADQLGLPVIEVENVNTPEFVEQIRGLGAALMLAIAFGQKLGPQFLAATPHGAINLHASLLPKYRGAAPINWAIVRGETRTGCTVFRIVSRMDAGPILSQDETVIGSDETAGELHDRLAILGVTTVQSALELLERQPPPPGSVQEETAASLAPKLKKSDGYIDFDRPAQAIVNHIRGMTPWPGATATYVAANGRTEVVTITKAHVVPARPNPLTPGLLDEDLHVETTEDAISVMEIQPASSRVMAWHDFVNGRHVHPGDRLERIGIGPETTR